MIVLKDGSMGYLKSSADHSGGKKFQIGITLNNFWCSTFGNGRLSIFVFFSVRDSNLFALIHVLQYWQCSYAILGVAQQEQYSSTGCSNVILICKK